MSGRDHSKSYCFAMKKSSVTRNCFDPVAERVSKIQQGAASCSFLLIALDKRGFDLDTSPDQVRQFPIPIPELCQKSSFSNDPVLNYFGKAFIPFAPP